MPPMSPTDPPPLDALLAEGDDRAVVERLMDTYGDAVLERCRLRLGGSQADVGLVWDARHETFVEAFKALAPHERLPDPERWLLERADRTCALVLKAERGRLMPREPFTPPEGDWRGPVRWELDVLGEEAPEKYRGRRHGDRGGPSIWRGVALAGFSLVLLVGSGLLRC